ncbi:hypothetical protein D0962_28375 [Leptolyngbyaceae cyanobacterium CCMR0082]|uniref:Uncharacterized protein n=1 Tax=Adonisia turfae CCMR0082 TaxID=2304604 RepID=A0A6M0SDR4_9CYAN|nr:hypothetical protein [Adonisia turfae]NEZ66629.1 hypothetical protein [Adonisia turfae CCMR0082]
MSWVAELTKLAKKILHLNRKVDTNAEQIAQLSERLDSLTKFTQRIASAVKEQKRDLSDYQKDINSFQKHNQSEREKLVLQLENALLKLQVSLNGKTPNSLQVTEFDQKRLLADGTKEQD